MTNHKGYTRQTKWLALLGLGFWAGCSFFGDDPAEQVPPVDTQPESQWVQPEQIEPVSLYDHVFEVDPSIAKHVEYDEEMLSIPLAKADTLQDRQVGDIVYSDEEPPFVLEISAIENNGDYLHFHGHEPELTDVVESGEFEVFLPPAIIDESGMAVDKEDLIIDMVDDEQGQEFQQRQQELLSNLTEHEIDVMSADYGVDFSDWDILELSHGNTTVRVNGELRFRPGVVATIKISSFNDISVGLEASGQAKLQAGWEVEVADAFDMERSFDIPVTDPVNFSVVGFQFTVEPYLAGRTKASGSGDATYKQDFVAQGGVAAGVTTQIGSTPEPYFTTNFSTRNSNSAERASLAVNLEASLQFKLEAGVRLYRGSNTNGNMLAQAVPLQANFSANGQLSQPDCPYDASLTFDAYVQTHSPSHHWDHNYTGFSTDGDFSAPGCMREDEPAECQIDSDCRSGGPTQGASMACESNVCVPDSDMIITLNWDSDVNLNLNVSTPSGEVISNANPDPTYESGEMFEASCGGCDGGADPDPAVGYTERIIFDGADTSNEFHIWIDNDDGFHDDSAEGEVPYLLTLNHRDVYEETFTSRMSGEAGSSSVVYRYKVPAMP